MNVCIYRIPRGISVTLSRSFCPFCKRTLSWYDLIPVVSYVLLNGRCRYCGNKISIRYPLVEVSTGIWFILSFCLFGTDMRFFQSVIFFCFVLLTSMIDLELMVVVNNVVLAGAAAGSIMFLLVNGTSMENLLDLALGVGTGWALISLIRLVSKGGMGDGDPYIAMMVATFLGFKLTLLTLLLSFVIGGFTGVILLLTEKRGRKDAIPFGPFLGIAAISSYLCGNLIIQWYMNLFSL